ncbi:hypothetical protein JDV02_008762 [Purpureocillium takamizusanense]|uniref:Uncharacterized protein n=1 Tax=Purpureocillium takamizusanense TaxID=2060973 RepID=A0A9Q8QMP9_9HYPO|nr:uncharacterized protein JDV02_008762 [Purpureocillium takamizusanense]UNI22918.1 hypothetical protein JDV02_008762 [Purpureocillium takamizusanense]
MRPIGISRNKGERGRSMERELEEGGAQGKRKRKTPPDQENPHLLLLFQASKSPLHRHHHPPSTIHQDHHPSPTNIITTARPRARASSAASHLLGNPPSLSAPARHLMRRACPCLLPLFS